MQIFLFWVRLFSACTVETKARRLITVFLHLFLALRYAVASSLLQSPSYSLRYFSLQQLVAYFGSNCSDYSVLFENFAEYVCTFRVLCIASRLTVQLDPFVVPPNGSGFVWAGLTSQQHLLQQVVYLGQAAELNEVELFDHLPGDALQCGQEE